MLHYILVFLVYGVFIALLHIHKHGRDDTNSADLSKVILIAIIIILMLTVLYEKFLVFVLLHNVHSHTGYIMFSAVGSGLYMILFFIGLIVIANLMGRNTPDKWTIMFFIISLIANIFLVTRATGIYYEEMVKNFGDRIFDDFYKSLSTTNRTDTANALLNLKWMVMAVPAGFYLYQLLTTDDYS